MDQNRLRISSYTWNVFHLHEEVANQLKHMWITLLLEKKFLNKKYLKDFSNP